MEKNIFLLLYINKEIITYFSFFLDVISYDNMKII